MYSKKANSSLAAPELLYTLLEPEDCQAADLWSLGCILSEVATWLILGPSGLQAYTNLRKEAIKRFNYRDKMSGMKVSMEDDDLGQHDFFHNGKDVLPEILQWHDYLRLTVRRIDPFATDVLTIVDLHLLGTASDGRISAEQLHNKCATLEQNLSPSTAELSLAVVESVKAVEDTLKPIPPAQLFSGQLPIRNTGATKSKKEPALSPVAMVDQAQVVKAFSTDEKGEANRKVAEIQRKRANIEAMAARYMEEEKKRADRREVGQTPNSAALTRVLSIRQPKQQSSLKRLERVSNIDHSDDRKQHNVLDVHYVQKDAFSPSISQLSKWKDQDALVLRHYENRDIVSTLQNLIYRSLIMPRNFSLIMVRAWQNTGIWPHSFSKN